MADTFTLQDVREHFQTGSTFTYKNFTDIMEIPYYSGGSGKEAQIKLLRRCANIDKSGRYYTIIEFYDEMRPAERRRRSDAIYEPLIETILMSQLADQENHSCIHTAKQWFELLGMVNHNYLQDANLPKKRRDEIALTRFAFATDELVEKYALYNYDKFFERTSHKFRQTLIDSLQGISNDGRLSYNDHCFMTYEYKDVLSDLTGRWGTELIPRRSTEEEINFVRQIRDEILTDMGYEDKFSLYKSGRASLYKYYRECNARITEKFPVESIVEEIEITYFYPKSDAAYDIWAKNARQELNNTCLQWAMSNAENLNQSRYKKREYDLDMQKELSNFYIKL